MATPAAPFAFGKLAADELPLDEELPVERWAARLTSTYIELVQILDVARSRRGTSSRSPARSLSRAAADERKSARLRARRMRLQMTMSDSRAGAPQPFAASIASSSSFTCDCHGHDRMALARHSPSAPSAAHFASSVFSFQLANLVAKLGGPFVIFLLHRFLHLAPQADQLASARRCPPACPRGPLADVLASRRECWRSAAQLFLETDVVVRAAQPALVAELVERDAAHRARPLIELGQLFGRLAELQLLGQHVRPALGATAGSSSACVRYCRARAPRRGATPAACRRSAR